MPEGNVAVAEKPIDQKQRSEQSPRKEGEIRRSMNPGVARLLVGATSVDADRFHPNKSHGLTPSEATKLVNAQGEQMRGAFSLAEAVSLESRNKTKTDASTWFANTRGFAERQMAKDDGSQSERIAVLHAVGLINGSHEATADVFFHKYFYDKKTGKAKSDVGRFVRDIASGCMEDGVVNLDKLEQRLDLVKGILPAFGKEHSADLMVRDFIRSYGLLNQTGEVKQTVVQEAHNAITQELPQDAKEREYLTALLQIGKTQSTERPQPLQVKEKKETRVSIKTGWATEKGSHENNEDQVWVDAEKGIGIVCDGVGGGDGGGRDSRLVMKSLQTSFDSVPPHKTAEDAKIWLLGEVNKANDALKEAKQKGELPHNVGTTLSLAYVWQGEEGRSELITVNIGDSRIAWEIDGKMKDLTIDDSMTVWYPLKDNAEEIYEEIEREAQARGLQNEQLGRFMEKQLSRLLDTDHPRSPQEASQMQQFFNGVEDPERQLRTEEQVILWGVRNIILGSVNGRNLGDIYAESYPIPKGKKVRVFGFSDGITDVVSSGRMHTAIKDAPQDTADALIAAAKVGDMSPRSKGPPPGDDKSVFVMDISFEEVPATVELKDFSAEPVTRDDDKLLHILLHPEDGFTIGSQLNEFAKTGEEKVWEPEEQQRAEAGVRRLFEVEFGGLPGFDLGTTVMDARRSLGKSPELVAARLNARFKNQGRGLWYQGHEQGWDNVELMRNGGNFLHFGDPIKPPDGTPGKFPTGHRIYVTPKEWAVGEVASEVILRAREKGYGLDPYGKIWDESSIRMPDDEALSYRGKRSSRVDRLLFYPRTQTQQDILLSSLKDLSQERPELFEENPPLITEKVVDIPGVGLAEEPVQGKIVFEDDKKSYTSSRAELLFAVQSELLDSLVGPKSEKTETIGNRVIDARFVTLRNRLADETQTQHIRDTMRRLIRQLSPQFGVDPDSFYKNLRPE